MKLSEFKETVVHKDSVSTSVEAGNKIKDLELILDVLKNINSSLILEDVLEQVLTHAIKITESERGFIVLKNEEDELEYKLGLDSKGIKLPEHFFNISTTVVEDVFKTGRSKFIEGAQSDTNNHPSKSILKLALQTILCSPLVIDEKKIGVIYVDSKFLHKINNRQITYTFEILAGQAAIAIRNAQLYKDLSNAKEKVEASDKLKTAFLSQMSHEIRTPINIILNYNALIREEFRDKIKDRMQFIFDGVESSGNRLIRTLDNILNMSSIQSGNFEIHSTRINLYNMLTDIITEFSSSAVSKNLELILTSKVKDYVINGDEYSVMQIFHNLIDNALKYTQEGKVELLIYDDANENICVDVMDTGIGISKDYLPRLFSPFSQEEIGYSRRFDGSGLGLALVKKFVELNHCDVSVKSEKSVGTTFTLTFNKNNVH